MRDRVYPKISAAVMLWSLAAAAQQRGAANANNPIRTRIERLASECRAGVVVACREVIPVLRDATVARSRFVDADTERTWAVEGEALPGLEPLFDAFVRALREHAMASTTPIAEATALAAEFPADRVLARAAREQTLRRGEGVALREALCEPAETLDVAGLLRRHPAEMHRQAFVAELARCVTMLPIDGNRRRWGAIIEALGHESGAPVEDAWIVKESGALQGNPAAPAMVDALRALPGRLRGRYAEAVVSNLRARSARDQGAVDALVLAVPGVAELERFQLEVAGAVQAAQAAAAAEQARLEQARQATAAAQVCQSQCRTVADACATAQPAALMTRCMPEFERCQQRCAR